MLLDARFLRDVSSVNSWAYTTQIDAYEGEAVPVYLQLVDRASGTDDGGPGGGRRYAPAAGATLSVILESIDDSKRITRFASQPFVGDASLWLVSIAAVDALRGTIQIKLALNQGGAITNAVIDNAIRLRSTQRA